MDKDDQIFEIESSSGASEDGTENDLQLEGALKKMKSYQRPSRKKSRVMGLCSFGLAMLAGLVLLILSGNALLSFLNKNLTMDHIRLLINGVLIAAVISAIALLLSIITYFLKKQKKGFAISATVISVLILLVSGMAFYAYQYMFGSIKQDEKFNQLSNEQLYVKEAEPDGEINRQTEAPLPTIPREEIEKIVQEKVENNPEIEIEWENLNDMDLPQEALDRINSALPEGKSYLTGDHAQILNFALFGLDKGGASDSVMIFSFDRVHHKLKLISIPRDSYVRIPAWGAYSKLAYPYFWGGAEWAVGTINHNFYMNITEYIAVDMSQLEKIIDLVGGVYVDLDYDELHCLRQYSGLKYGRCLLSGKAAVSYSRLRESSATDNEEKRTGRQREVLMSIMEQLQTLPWTDYPEFIRACLGMCTTSFDNEQFLELCAEVVQNDYTIEQHALIAHLDYWGGRLGEARYFYVVYDLNRASDMLYRIIYEDLYISGYKDEE